MPKRANKFYIKQRVNPQCGTYFVACGKMSKSAAKRAERPLYGDNVMHSYGSEAEYRARLAQLEADGELVQ